MKSESKKRESAKRKNTKLKKISIESYGVKIKIETDMNLDFQDIKFRLAKKLPDAFKLIPNDIFEHNFYITQKDSIFELHKEAEKVAESETFDALLEQLESYIRITVAEYAVGKVFIHAGVVAINERALILPAKSFHGKTTLVAELVKAGAVYYSDEYAVLDENGYVHPFPKMLSMRGIIDDYTQMDLPVEEFGGNAGTKPIPVALVLITEYKRNAKWKPQELSAGQGIMEILPHTLPIRNKPEFTLNVLNNVAERAIITKTKRAEANVTARLLISFFETQAFKI